MTEWDIEMIHIYEKIHEDLYSRCKPPNMLINLIDFTTQRDLMLYSVVFCSLYESMKKEPEYWGIEPTQIECVSSLFNSCKKIRDSAICHLDHKENKINKIKNCYKDINAFIVTGQLDFIKLLDSILEKNEKRKTYV